MSEFKQPESDNELAGKIERLIEKLAERLAEGVVKGIVESGLLELRASGTNQATGGEKKPTAQEPPAQQKPQLPPLGIPLSSLASMLRQPSGLSPQKPLPRRRTVSRPTVTYRTSPQREEQKSGTCSEPGCDKPARARGLCTLHYQRLRYRERKIDQKQMSVPLPPPPPARRVTPRGGTRAVFALLYEKKGKKVLAGLIHQLKFGRADLVEKLNEQYRGMPGVPLELEDVLRALHYHNLTGALYEREREILCRQLRKQGGSLAKTAQKMKMTSEQLQERMDELGLAEEFTRIRNEFKEQILERSDLKQKLDLALTKEKYLADLGIDKEVDDSIRRELEAAMGRMAQGGSEEETQRFICEELSLDEQRYRRLVRRYGLAGTTAEAGSGG
ncbi:MAG: hypothetical protein D6806_13855 [Deltaproteobacteria bacterium]|nr:MAG: hypothetical protein D6806_13855 [Deltaproteobacteria bacterium]